MNALSPVAICMACDAGYAFPTAVVARSIAQMEIPNTGPIHFVWIDNDPPPFELVSFLEKSGIILVATRNSFLPTMARDYEGHLTPAASACFFLSELLEQFPIDRFLYLDGDVEVKGSLGALAETDLPRGYIAAAEEYSRLFHTDDSRSTLAWKKKIHDLGMPPESSYFNSGVIFTHMQTWAEIAAEARVFLSENIEVCTNYDQCALNAVSYDRRLVLSPRWNFQPLLFPLNVEASIKPNIVHFSGAHKPWNSVPLARPWQARKPFLNARAELPELWKKMTQGNSTLRSLGFYRSFINRQFKRSNGERRKIILDYVANTTFLDKI